MHADWLSAKILSVVNSVRKLSEDEFQRRRVEADNFCTSLWRRKFRACASKLTPNASEAVVCYPNSDTSEPHQYKNISRALSWFVGGLE